LPNGRKKWLVRKKQRVKLQRKILTVADRARLPIIGLEYSAVQHIQQHVMRAQSAPLDLQRSQGTGCAGSAVRSDGERTTADRKFELRQMRKQGSGAIVNCSSLGGLVGAPGRGTYHAAKHGVLGLTKIATLLTTLRWKQWLSRLSPHSAGFVIFGVSRSSKRTSRGP
jgi:hypothetical protein